MTRPEDRLVLPQVSLPCGTVLEAGSRVRHVPSGVVGTVLDSWAAPRGELPVMVRFAPEHGYEERAGLRIGSWPEDGTMGPRLVQRCAADGVPVFELVPEPEPAPQLPPVRVTADWVVRAQAASLLLYELAARAIEARTGFSRRRLTVERVSVWPRIGPTGTASVRYRHSCSKKLEASEEFTLDYLVGLAEPGEVARYEALVRDAPSASDWRGSR